MFDLSLVPDNIRFLILHDATAAHFYNVSKNQGFGYHWFLEQLAFALAKQKDAMIAERMGDAMRNPRPIVVDANGELVHD